MVGMVRETGISVTGREQRPLRQALTAWAREGRLWTRDPDDQQLYPFSALRVFEPLALVASGRCLVSEAPGVPQPSGAVRLAVVPLQHYRDAAQDVLRLPDEGYEGEAGLKRQQGRRSRRLERLLNVTFEDQRWLRRAERLVSRECPAEDIPLACRGVRCGLYSAAMRYLRPRVFDDRVWAPLLERAREDEGLLNRLVEMDGFLESDFCMELLSS